MKWYLGLAVLISVGIVSWRIGGSISSDATSMAVGVLLGVVAGIPVALLMVASGRRRMELDDDMGERPRRAGEHPAQMAAPPPVILVTNGAMQSPSPPQGQLSATQPWPELSAWPQQSQGREFKVVGESEERLDEW